MHHPSIIVPSVVGTPKRQPIILRRDHQDTYVGDDAQIKRAILSLEYPVEHGIVTNWDNMEKVRSSIVIVGIAQFSIYHSADMGVHV